jgi:hypothetical protein
MMDMMAMLEARDNALVKKKAETSSKKVNPKAAVPVSPTAPGKLKSNPNPNP